MIENINISAAQCWILMAITVLIIMMFVKRKLEFLKAAVAFGILFSALRWTDLHEQVQSQNMIVYKVSGHRAIDLFDHGHAWFYTDSVLTGDDQKVRFHLTPNRQLHGIQQVDAVAMTPLSNGFQIMVWHGKKILCITQKPRIWPEGISADMLIISNNADVDLSDLPRNLLSSLIILDSSNSFYFADKMMQKAESMGLKAYSVMHQGAFKQQL
jgi:competence protein ComEC